MDVALLGHECIGQQRAVKVIAIPILNVGTGRSAMTLTKEPFEGDTVYNLTFRSAERNSPGKLSTHGFFIFELVAFGKALQMALSMDSDAEVRFSGGTIERWQDGSNKRGILVQFVTGAGSCRMTQTNALKFIDTVKSIVKNGTKRP